MKTKKLFAVLTIVMMSCISIPCSAKQLWPDGIGNNKLNVSTCVAVGGSWGERWNNQFYRILSSISENHFIITLYPRNEEAWNYFCKITIDDFVMPSKKADKLQKKSGKWYSYPCKVEFFYNVEYPSIEECFANYGGFIVNSKDTDVKKRVVAGRLNLNPDFFTAGNGEKVDMTLNLWLDNLGFAISFNKNLQFKLK